MLTAGRKLRWRNGECSSRLPFRYDALPTELFRSSPRSHKVSSTDHCLTLNWEWTSNCFHVALRPRRRDGLLGTGIEWEGDWESEGSTRGNRPKKDRRDPWTTRQNNRSVKAVVSAQPLSSDLCTATVAVSTACAWTESQRQCPLHCCWRTTWTTRSKRGPTCSGPAPPPYSWSLLGKFEGPAPPPSSKISWSFDLAWNLEKWTRTRVRKLLSSRMVALGPIWTYLTVSPCYILLCGFMSNFQRKGAGGYHMITLCSSLSMKQKLGRHDSHIL